MPTAPPVFMRRKRKPWKHNSDNKRKVGGRALQRARAKLFAKEPRCVECLKHGRVSIATIRDHIIPLAFGGEDAEENTQGLCGPCHDAKTAEESKRGRGIESLSLGGRKAAG